MRLKNIYLITGIFVIHSMVVAQRPSAPKGKIVPGVGLYSGLNKVSAECDTCAGNFFVSPTNDAREGGMRWLAIETKIIGNASKKNGLRNNHRILKWVYPGVDIERDGLRAHLSQYPDGLSGNAAGAVEVCFQKNYKDGKLASGTTPQNMWYLPAFEELKLMWTHNYFNKKAFGEPFFTGAYWSSTEFSATTALTNDFNYSGALINSFKAAAYNIRCVRKHVPPAAAIGSKYAGGLVFYLDSTEQHGYACAEKDQSQAIAWGTNNEKLTGASGIELGTGADNTRKIVQAFGPGNYAAKLCEDLVLNGFNDWFLPSQDEANLMYNNLTTAGVANFGPYYWTSSEENASFAWYSYFGTDAFYSNFKISPHRIRCIRKF